MRLKTLIVIVALSLQLGCAVKPKYLVEQTLKEEAQQEVNARQEEWNWKNRHRLRQDTNFQWRRNQEAINRRNVERKRFYRNSQLGVYSQRYNNNAKFRTERKPKKHNGVKVHKKNYWSKTTKHPKEE